ncbi:MAG: hypothetical protein QW507_01800 [Candidatus Nanoarchaeia archaeon]|nr:hypothetical protein [Candidatus Haiyanarchaeum thermophilum]MCW1302852.1 hypothetical protein [Candidatus Haiyanarchaeum thermophilum]MCW1303532.1 hypothetical protein [Candidatus Haiyanarchaeum thermophilum]MCW1306712.1 hypothetical protein [Candidatus Haiyanarchaeum thermophilum]MCW1307332.1 hypothetical protein [Candidatus Haiyanarchaeum thermophilum]
MVSVEEVRKELSKFATLTEKLLFLRLISRELDEGELRKLEDELLQSEISHREFEAVEVRGFTEENFRGEVVVAEEVESSVQQAQSFQPVMYVPMERSLSIREMGPSISVERERGVEENEEDVVKRILEKDRFSMGSEEQIEHPVSIAQKFGEILGIGKRLEVKKRIQSYIQGVEEL